MSPESHLRVAVIGSGPAGFYAVGQLLASGLGVDVDLFERLVTPWGLVRFGVAPDHPKIKEVSRVFEKTAKNSQFRYFGNVEVGKDVTADDLRTSYDAVVYAVGARSDRRMGIPGEDLSGSWPATEFVAWYNGHPDAQDHQFNLNVERVVVVGAGNVAVDVARMLALTPEELRITDATDQSIAAIGAASIKEIVMLARRGPAQAAFTTPELKELGELAGADVVVDPADLVLDPASEASLADDTNAQRNVAILREYATRPRSSKPKVLRLRFMASPVAIHGASHVEAVDIVRNKLVDDGKGGMRAVPAGEPERVLAGLVLRSVGYQGVPLPGVPFDAKSATIPNREGRVVDEKGQPIPGLYTVGWIKRGPSGVIGTNKKDASETIEKLVEDAKEGRIPRAPGGDVAQLLRSRGVRYIPYAGWEAVDALERALGKEQGRPRVKLARWPELISAAEKGGPA